MGQLTIVKNAWKDGDPPSRQVVVFEKYHGSLEDAIRYAKSQTTWRQVAVIEDRGPMPLVPTASHKYGAVAVYLKINQE